ncbi:MAG: pyridoxal 5'-phosphate synthase glutaminase subunit PdxT [Fimbriimonadaceae bacterium]|nr:pyridoxal 5'-phosphate synthase glutaminase subunit PdxT [Fimbriimonadaceae bacterium]
MGKVGVLSVQGDFARHRHVFHDLGIETQEVRVPEDLVECDRIVLPGGESTTIGMLMERTGLLTTLKAEIRAGLPAWGTCAGMILLAREVEGGSGPRLDILDVTVRRNAFGRQVHSFESDVEVEGVGTVTAVFIRAPIVTRVGAGVKVLSTVSEGVVAVREGNVLATSFHPELTGDPRVHEWFASL